MHNYMPESYSGKRQLFLYKAAVTSSQVGQSRMSLRHLPETLSAVLYHHVAQLVLPSACACCIGLWVHSKWNFVFSLLACWSNVLQACVHRQEFQYGRCPEKLHRQSSLLSLFNQCVYWYCRDAAYNRNARLPSGHATDAARRADSDRHQSSRQLESHRSNHSERSRGERGTCSDRDRNRSHR